MPLNRPTEAFRALADPTRREILELLRAGPRTSGEIAGQFDSSWPTISRHLAVLREGGLVMTERRGQEIYYELNTSVFQDLVQRMMQWANAKPERAGARASQARRGNRQQEA
jgi:ArsR family transcriptional regulator, arsenate/arsenite/antimonite-responsive transcriptional repressor